MIVHCQICGKQQDVIPSRAKTYKTCSRTCSAKRASMLLTNKAEKTCAICQRTFLVKPSHADKRQTCSATCNREWRRILMSGQDNHQYGLRGAQNPSWHGGRMIRNGYVWLYMPDHPDARGNYIKEHRYVMEQHMGRRLLPHEDVHHKNEIKTDNRIENLELLTRSEHSRNHNLADPQPRNQTGRFVSRSTL